MIPVSIIVTSYDAGRRSDIHDLLVSIKEQVNHNYELVYVTERDSSLPRIISSIADELGLEVRVIHNNGKPGLPEARNLGSKIATGEVLAFVDDDVVLTRHWSLAVEESFKNNQRVAAITGPAYPIWVGPVAEWLPLDLDWLIGCTRWFKYEKLVEVTNCWGMNMAFRRNAFFGVGGFSTSSTETSRYMRQETTFFSGRAPRPQHGRMAEDVDISLRISAGYGKILFVPEMKVLNKVYEYRLTNRYIVKRASWVGYTRRNVRRTTLNRTHQVFSEAGLFKSFPRNFFKFEGDSGVTISNLHKRYAVLILSTFALFAGYFIGPIGQ